MVANNWIAWRNSVQRDILLDDLLCGVLPVEASELSAEQAWIICYSQMAEFASVPFSQFKARLQDHRKQVKERLARSRAEEIALTHDRTIFPRQLRNSRGELVFDLAPAKLLLRRDMKANKHKQMTPKELQSTRDEYSGFNSRKFKERIYQEIRRNKFINYLNAKRDKQGIQL